MNTQIKTININNVSQANTDQLKQELARSLDITARHMEYLAVIWRELENRGEDLSELRHGLMAYLPLIANNRINASLVVKYAGQKTLLSALSRLPIQQQNDLAESGYVTVMEYQGDSLAEVQTPLSELASRDIHRVFGESALRTPTEQATLITKKTKTRLQRPRRARTVKFNSHDRSITVGSVSVTVEKLLPVLSEYYGFDVKKLIEKHNGR